MFLNCSWGFHWWYCECEHKQKQFRESLSNLFTNVEMQTSSSKVVLMLVASISLRRFHMHWIHCWVHNLSFQFVSLLLYQTSGMMERFRSYFFCPNCLFPFRIVATFSGMRNCPVCSMSVHPHKVVSNNFVHFHFRRTWKREKFRNWCVIFGFVTILCDIFRKASVWDVKQINKTHNLYNQRKNDLFEKLWKNLNINFNSYINLYTNLSIVNKCILLQR